MPMASCLPNIPEKYASISLSHEAEKSKEKSEEGREKSWNLTQEIMRARVNTIESTSRSSDETGAFMVADMGEVYRQYQRWKVNLPRVKPYYGETLTPVSVFLADQSSRQVQS